MSANQPDVPDFYPDDLVLAEAELIKGVAGYLYYLPEAERKSAAVEVFDAWHDLDGVDLNLAVETRPDVVVPPIPAQTSMLAEQAKYAGRLVAYGIYMAFAGPAFHTEPPIEPPKRPKHK